MWVIYLLYVCQTYSIYIGAVFVDHCAITALASGSLKVQCHFSKALFSYGYARDYF